MKQPIIGISPRYAFYKETNRHFLQVNTDYIDQIVNRNAIPLILVPGPNLLNSLKMCDGILEIGGDDIDPKYYGETNDLGLSKGIDEETDLIDKEIEEFKHRNPNTDVNIDFLIDLRHGIKLVDGQHYDALKLDAFLKKLPMKDTNAILNALDKINLEVGVNNTLVEKCKNSRCGLDYTTSFRFTSEFFRPKTL